MDAQIFQDACTSSLEIPAGKYFLADAGIPSMLGALVPYCSTCYHLAEWCKASLRYVHPHNVISALIVFQACKQGRTIQFASCLGPEHYRVHLWCHQALLSYSTSPPEYLIEVQAFIPIALCVLHNIITSHNKPENNSIMQDWAASIEWGDGIEEDAGDEEIGFEDGGEAEAEVEEISPIDSKALCDTNTEAMWNDYQGHLQTQGEL